MEVFGKINENRDLTLALGFFDGVHLAHKEILETAVLRAKENGIKSAVVTFQKSPGGYFDPKKNINIQTANDRLKMLEESGVDYVYMLDFCEFINLSAKEYLENVLVKNFSPKFIVTGFNHTFGARKEGLEAGNSEYLKKNEILGYRYIEIGKIRKNNVLISSTNIKKFLQDAYIKEANSLLGYKFNIEGIVQKGLGLARKLGYNTANIKWPENIVKLPYGVYSGEVICGGKIYKSLINWGIKPTVELKGSKEPILEAHILNFDKEIYGENIRVYFEYGIREEKKFDSLSDLKNAIENDIKTVNQES